MPPLSSLQSVMINKASSLTILSNCTHSPVTWYSCQSFTEQIIDGQREFLSLWVVPYLSKFVNCFLRIRNHGNFATANQETPLMWHRTITRPWTDGGEGQCVTGCNWWAGGCWKAQTPEIVGLSLESFLSTKLACSYPTLKCSKWPLLCISPVWLWGSQGESQKALSFL